jgi:hypothetical protein
MDNSQLSQSESKRVADYLMENHKVRMPTALSLWRYHPDEAVNWIKRKWPTCHITAAEIVKAAGRSETA